ncbi:hypothetical protein IJL65_00785 [bacterium]|nr:hypothetical protein [bacterium]
MFPFMKGDTAKPRGFLSVMCKNPPSSTSLNPPPFNKGGHFFIWFATPQSCFAIQLPSQGANFLILIFSRFFADAQNDSMI